MGILESGLACMWGQAILNYILSAWCQCYTNALEGARTTFPAVLWKLPIWIYMASCRYWGSWCQASIRAVIPNWSWSYCCVWQKMYLKLLTGSGGLEICSQRSSLIPCSAGMSTALLLFSLLSLLSIQYHNKLAHAVLSFGLHAIWLMLCAQHIMWSWLAKNDKQPKPTACHQNFRNCTNWILRDITGEDTHFVDKAWQECAHERQGPGFWTLKWGTNFRTDANAEDQNCC